MFVRSFWSIMVRLNFWDEKDDTVVDSTISPEKLEASFELAAETPRSLYQPFEGSDDSDETHKPSTSSRKKLNNS